MKDEKQSVRTFWIINKIQQQKVIELAKKKKVSQSQIIRELISKAR